MTEQQKFSGSSSQNENATGGSDARSFAVGIAQLLADRHCENVRLLDVKGLSQICDFILIATGTSDRQMKSLAAELEQVGAEQGHPAFRTSRDDATTWVVIDFIDIMVHLFEPELRDYYDLDGMWSDGEQLTWTRKSA